MAHRYFELAAATAMASVAATVLATAQAPSPRRRPRAPEEWPGRYGGRLSEAGARHPWPHDDGRRRQAGRRVRADERAHHECVDARSANYVGSGDGFDERGGRGTRAEDGAVRGARARVAPDTSGTGSTSVQTTERPPNEAARGGATAANPAPVRGADTMCKVVGLSDAELTPLLGKEVEVRATLDANTMGSAALRQPAATMGREPASTPSASTPPPEPTQAPAPPPLPELKATAIKATGGRCQGT